MSCSCVSSIYIWVMLWVNLLFFFLIKKNDATEFIVIIWNPFDLKVYFGECVVFLLVNKKVKHANRWTITIIKIKFGLPFFLIHLFGWALEFIYLILFGGFFCLIRNLNWIEWQKGCFSMAFFLFVYISCRVCNTCICKVCTKISRRKWTEKKLILLSSQSQHSQI